MTVCIYLEGGKVLFQFKRPSIPNNDAFDAGGLVFTVEEPSQQLLPRAAFPQDQDRRGELGHLVGKVDQLPHHAAGAEDEIPFVLVSDLGGERDDLST